MAPLYLLNTYIVNGLIFIDLRVPSSLFSKKLAICSNDYASKARITILCTKTCCIAWDVFPKSNLWCNVQNYGSLARMSTWTFYGNRVWWSGNVFRWIKHHVRWFAYPLNPPLTLLLQQLPELHVRSALCMPACQDCPSGWRVQSHDTHPHPV